MKGDGKTWGVPMYAETRGYAYNKILFAETGLDPSKSPDSWDETRAITKKLTKVDDAKVLVSGFETIWGGGPVVNELDWFAKQAGSGLTINDNRTSNYTDDLVLQALEYMAELYQITHPAGLAPQSEGLFGNNTVGIVRGGPWILQWAATGSAAIQPEAIGLLAPRRTAPTDL